MMILETKIRDGERRKQQRFRRVIVTLLCSVVCFFLHVRIADRLLLTTNITQSERGNETIHSETEEIILRNVVVAHCKENISWLDQFISYDPNVCEHTRFLIYSKCSMNLKLNETVPAVSDCATIHTLKNHGTEEYAYLMYIQEHYNTMPQMVSFIQGGGITENPHIIYDIMENMPGLQYKSLSRHVSQAWHYVKYDNYEKGEKGIVTNHLNFLLTQPHVHNTGWMSDYRGMFTVSREQIKEHPLNVYDGISTKIRDALCQERNCCMETFFSSIFKCNSHFYGDGNCKHGVYKDIANVVFEEDYQKNGCSADVSPVRDTNWIECGHKMMFFAKSCLNGALICISRRRNDNNITNVNGLQLLTEMIARDSWKADYANMTWNMPSQWHHQKDILEAQNKNDSMVHETNEIMQN